MCGGAVFYRWACDDCYSIIKSKPDWKPEDLCKSCQEAFREEVRNLEKNY